MHKLVASADPDNSKSKSFDLLGDTDYKGRVTKGAGGYMSSAVCGVTNAPDRKQSGAGKGVNLRKNLRGGILALSVTHVF